MSSSFTVSSSCTVLLSSGSVGEDITVSDFELTGDCGELNSDDGRTEIPWAVFLYVWADDVKLRPPIRERKTDNRVAENMANVSKSYAISFGRVHIEWFTGHLCRAESCEYCRARFLSADNHEQFTCVLDFSELKRGSYQDY